MRGMSIVSIRVIHGAAARVIRACGDIHSRACFDTPENKAAQIKFFYLFLN
jgi:hypothetical protein